MTYLFGLPFVVGLSVGPVFTEVMDNKNLPFSLTKDGQTLNGIVPASGRPMLEAMALDLSGIYSLKNWGKFSLGAEADLGFALAKKYSSLFWSAAARPQYNFSDDVYAFVRAGYGGFGAFPSASDSIIRNGVLLAAGLGARLGFLDGNCSLSWVLTGSETQSRALCGVSLPIGRPDKKEEAKEEPKLKDETFSPERTAQVALEDVKQRLKKIENMDIWEWMKAVRSLTEDSKLYEQLGAANAFVLWLVDKGPAANEPSFEQRTDSIIVARNYARMSVGEAPKFAKQYDKLAEGVQNLKGTLLHSLIKLVFLSKNSIFERALTLVSELNTIIEHDDLSKPDIIAKARKKFDTLTIVLDNGLFPIIDDNGKCVKNLLGAGVVDAITPRKKLACYREGRGCGEEGIDPALALPVMKKKIEDAEEKIKDAEKKIKDAAEEKAKKADASKKPRKK